MINTIRSILNRNKKLYIVVNPNVSKGKIARVCATIGQNNPHMKYSKVIIVKANKTQDSVNDFQHINTLFTRIRYGRSIYDWNKLVNGRKISGVHIDAGHTQCEKGTLLAFGVITDEKAKIDLKLY